MRRRGARPLGLGLLLAGALLQAPARAQVPTPAAADTVTARPPADTAPADSVQPDTARTPLARAETPPLLEVGEQYIWTRPQLFATGALTLLDLLERLPGITIFRSGWLASPQYAAYLGNPVRIRVFLDGMEIVPLDPRSPGLIDVAEAQLWPLEEVAVERGADELRLYLRSWRVTSTDTRTRIDFVTGDQNTNLFRGFFGRRFRNGGALQLAGQQYGTSEDPSVGGGDELALMARLGWARRRWSVDLFASRAGRTRDEQLPQAGPGGVAEQERTRTDAYLRGGYGDPRDGGWAQVMVGVQRFEEATDFRPGTDFAPADSADTTRTTWEYVAAGGYTRGGLRLSLTDRVYDDGDDVLNALSARAAYERSRVAISLYADLRGGDTTSLEELAVRVTPLRRVSVTGVLARRHGGSLGEPQFAARGEAGIRLGQMWVSGGVLRRDETMVPALTAFDTTFAPARTRRATGVFGAARGKFYRDLGVDAWVVSWDEPGFYRPRLQTRSELYLSTQWLSRFPSGNFGFLAAVAHEYRDNVLFPTVGAAEEIGAGSVVAISSHVLRSRLEVRIVDAVLFWTATYSIRPVPHELVPGFRQPQRRFLYGVRWEFLN